MVPSLAVLPAKLQTDQMQMWAKMGTEETGQVEYDGRAGSNGIPAWDSQRYLEQGLLFHLLETSMKYSLENC